MSTRRIMRQNHGASVARIYQPRSVGGMGLVCLEQAWETETAAYLHSPDTTFKFTLLGVIHSMF